MGYRPFAMWLPSRYNSVTKRGLATEDWPPLDPIRVPFDPFSNYTLHVTNVANILRGGDKQHLVEFRLHRYAHYFDDISILPLHRLSSSALPPGVDKILHVFLCHVVEQAPQTCRAVLEGQLKGSARTNPSVPLEYDMLATAAYGHKLVPPGVSRALALRAIARSQLPLEKTKCLSNKTLTEFEQLSWHMEQRLFPRHPEWKDTHREQFAYMRDVQKTFCTVDTEAVLKDPRSRSIEFFGQLNDTNYRMIHGRH